MKKILGITACLVTLAFALQPIIASAGNSDEQYKEIDFNSDSVLVIDGTESLEEQEKLWEEWLTNDDIEELIVLVPDLVNN